LGKLSVIETAIWMEIRLLQQLQGTAGRSQAHHLQTTSVHSSRH